MLMESDGDLPAGSPSYAVGLAPATAGGGGNGTGSSVPTVPLVRSLKVRPHQRGRAVTATIVPGRAIPRLRADVFLTPFHNGARSVASRIFRNLRRGIHRLSVRLPVTEARELAQGRRLHLVLRITVTAPSGGRRTYMRTVTLRR